MSVRVDQPPSTSQGGICASSRSQRRGKAAAEIYVPPAARQQQQRLLNSRSSQPSPVAVQTSSNSNRSSRESRGSSGIRNLHQEHMQQLQRLPAPQRASCPPEVTVPKTRAADASYLRDGAVKGLDDSSCIDSSDTVNMCIVSDAALSDCCDPNGMVVSDVAVNDSSVSHGTVNNCLVSDVAHNDCIGSNGSCDKNCGTNVSDDKCNGSMDGGNFSSGSNMVSPNQDSKFRNYLVEKKQKEKQEIEDLSKAVGRLANKYLNGLATPYRRSGHNNSSSYSEEFGSHGEDECYSKVDVRRGRPDQMLYVPPSRRHARLSDVKSRNHLTTASRCSPLTERYRNCRPPSPAFSITSVVSEFSGRQRYETGYHGSSRPSSRLSNCNGKPPNGENSHQDHFKRESTPCYSKPATSRFTRQTMQLIERCLNQDTPLSRINNEGESNSYCLSEEFAESFKDCPVPERDSVHSKENVQHPISSRSRRRARKNRKRRSSIRDHSFDSNKGSCGSLNNMGPDETCMEQVREGLVFHNNSKENNTLCNERFMVQNQSLLPSKSVPHANMDAAISTPSSESFFDDNKEIPRSLVNKPPTSICSVDSRSNSSVSQSTVSNNICTVLSINTSSDVACNAATNSGIDDHLDSEYCIAHSDSFETFVATKREQPISLLAECNKGITECNESTLEESTFDVSERENSDHVLSWAEEAEKEDQLRAMNDCGLSDSEFQTRNSTLQHRGISDDCGGSSVKSSAVMSIAVDASSFGTIYIPATHDYRKYTSPSSDCSLQSRKPAERFNASPRLSNAYSPPHVRSLQKGSPPRSVSPKDDSASYSLPQSDLAHVLELYDFPATIRTQDLVSAFKKFQASMPVDIKWVDDTHALIVLASVAIAQQVLDNPHPVIKARPLADASPASKAKAVRIDEELLPARARPKTSMMLARRLVSGALGVRVNLSKEEREKEAQALRQAKDQKRLNAKLRQDVWEGNV